MKVSIIASLSFVFASVGMSFTVPFTLYEVPLDIEVTHLRNSEGAIVLKFYQDNASYEQDKPFLKKSYSKSEVENGSLSIRINLPEGTYGIALIDDENNDGEMKYNRIGYPKEGFGFSNFTHKGLYRPKLSDFEFIHNPENGKVTIKVKYM